MVGDEDERLELELECDGSARGTGYKRKGLLEGVRFDCETTGSR